MAVKPNLQRLIKAKANLQAYMCGHKIKVVRGTRIDEVSERQLTKEVQVLERHTVDNEAGLQRALARVARKRLRGMPCASTLSSQAAIVDEVTCLADRRNAVLELAARELLGKTPPDLSLLVTDKGGAGREIVVLLTLDLELPTWAEEEATNGRGRSVFSKQHFMVVVGINRASTKFVVDTGGAQTMIDAKVADNLGLEVEKEGPNNWFGSFWGPASTPNPYYGRIWGPIMLRLSRGVTLTLPKVKVIEHGEPLAILEMDVLGWNPWPAWSFLSVQFNAASRQGVMDFVRGRQLETVALLSALQVAVLDASRPAGVNWSPDAVTGQRDAPAGADAQALTHQGQCL